MTDVVNTRNPFRTPQQTPANTGTAPSIATQSDLLSEELPPGYTTRPDLWSGEATLERGPARPFQQAPSDAQWRPQLTGRNSYSAGGQPQMQQYSPPPHPPPQQMAQMSDFARDFYASANAPTEAYSDSDSKHKHTYSDSKHSPTQYAPPPGAPPGAADDISPTTTPVPGRPLLHNGKMLVYPSEYQCRKCNNTGYKEGDPSRPCSRCWEAYGRPYTPALAAAASGSDAASSSSLSSSKFQRPLPPRAATAYSPPSWPPNASAAYPAQPQYNTSPGPSQQLIVQPGYGRQGGGCIGGRRGVNRAVNVYPAGAAVYAPGDMRLGGRVCWRCDGRGRTGMCRRSGRVCDVCRGVGRIY